MTAPDWVYRAICSGQLYGKTLCLTLGLCYFKYIECFCLVIPALYCTDGQPQDGGTPGAATTASLFIEIIDSPSFIQAESYRSCAHLAGHVHEQMLRYVDVGTSRFSVFVAELLTCALGLVLLSRLTAFVAVFIASASSHH